MPAAGTGWRQRLGLPAEGSARSERRGSSTAAFLEAKYQGGRLNAKDLAEGAQAACEDHEVPNPVDARLAAAAPTKKYKTNAGERLDTRNTSRAVQRVFRSRSSALPESYRFLCPL